MDISHGTVLPDENPVYHLAGVSKIYRKGGTEIPAVRDLDLEIRAGEWLAVQGKTGHGKTTLLQLLGGLDRPTRGKLEFGGARPGRCGRVRSQEGEGHLVRLHLPDLQPDPDPDRGGERGGGAHPARPAARANGANRVKPRWTASGSATAPSTCPASCPAASSSGWRSPAPWSRSRGCCSPTSRPATWTRTPGTRSSPCSTRLWRERGLTLILVTHDSAVARRAQRIGVMATRPPVDPPGHASVARLGLRQVPVVRRDKPLHRRRAPRPDGVRLDRRRVVQQRRRRSPTAARSRRTG